MSASALSPAQSCVSPLEAFHGDIQRPRVSLLYTAGLAVVAFAMVLLPAIYVSLVALAAWGVYFHLTHNTWLMSGSGGGIGKLILYLGPAMAGGILVFFMMKPLFARRQKPPAPLSLDPAKEPPLFSFVERICRLVGAPVPCRIDVDCQVNASASLRRGLWSRDLVLTIGLPLVAGLDMRQFAGVLAHEFGHFAQGAGMRLTYVIRNINFWFARVVYERDQWDVTLERTARSIDFRIAIILHAARGCVWLTRRILWALMHAGTAISCFMLRQMEFDADAYESKVAGSDAFESTAARLQLLSVASQMAFDHVRQDWAGRRLPENLPLLIHHKTGALPLEIHQKLASAVAAGKTGWFDTHPCDAERNRAARALNEPGIFRLERPATELFSDFAATSCAVTRHQYEKHWELDFATENLVSSQDMLRESAATSEADAAVRTFYGAVNVSLAPLLKQTAFPPLLDRTATFYQWQAARERSELLRPEAEKASAECVRQYELLTQFLAAQYLSAARFKIDPKEFNLPERSKKSIVECETAGGLAVDQANRMIREQTVKLEQFISALGARVSFALQLQSNPPPEAAEIRKALVSVGKAIPLAHQIGVRLRAFMVLAQNRGNHSQPGEVDQQMRRLADEMWKLIAEATADFASLQYPFPHSRGELSILEYVKFEKPTQHEFEAAYENSNALVERLFPLHYRLLGRLLVLAGAAEAELQSPEKSIPESPAVSAPATLPS